jgi:hypothetical protein
MVGLLLLTFEAFFLIRLVLRQFAHFLGYKYFLKSDTFQFCGLEIDHLAPVALADKAGSIQQF